MHASMHTHTGMHTYTHMHAVLTPIITIPPMDIVMGIGQSAGLSCTASSSDGMVTVSFETTAPSGQTVAPQSTNSIELTLNNGKIGDRGVYTCVASNARGTVRANATVYVVGECVTLFASWDHHSVLNR